MNDKICLLTLNVSGLQNKRKREKVFHWLKTKQYQIIFLQETHCGSEEDKRQWANEWGGASYWTSCSKDAVGVAILIKEKCQFKMQNSNIDEKGRWIKTDIQIEDKWYKLVNVYAPNKGPERKRFFRNELKVNRDNDSFIIMGGDFNCVLGKKDRRKLTNRTEEGQKELYELMKTYEITDIYRKRYPNKQSFTYFKRNTNVASRLDMWLVSHLLDPMVKKVDTCVAPHTDHHAVEITIKSSDIDKGPGRWLLNTEILKSSLFKETFTTFWVDWKKQKGEYESNRQWWEEGKYRIKDIAIWCGTKLRNAERHTLNNLESKLKEIMIQNPEQHTEIDAIKQQMNEIQTRKCDGAKMRAKVQWIENGERGTSFFHGLEKSRATNKQWTSIINKRGETKYGINDILDTQKEFYDELYSKSSLDQQAMITLLESLEKTLSEEDKEMCEREITKKEIDDVVKELKKGSSPGADGISYEFYREYWDVIGDDFAEVVIEISETECTESQYLGIIILLYKKGIREQLGNWRPITLLNCDYKILEKVFANRLNKVIPKLIKEDQKAYIKNRYIGDNARLMEDIIYECETNEIPGAMISIDQSKAFDRVEWEWLEKVMGRFNFGPKFLNWIKMLYAHAKSTILTNGYFSELIDLQRGLRQGSPLSSLLYLLQAEPFAESIRKCEELKGITIDNTEIKITAFADDTQIYISNEKSKMEMDRILELYSKASGAKVNKEKTEGILLGNMKEIEGIKWTKGPVKALGVPQGLIEDLSQFWDRILQKVRKRLEMWQKRNLTMQGKVHVIKTMALSTVTYAGGLKVIPDNKLNEINKEIWKYLWQGKTECVSREICMYTTGDGGLGMPNLNKLIRTRQIMMIKRILSDGDHKWKILPRKYLKSLDMEYNEEYFLLRAIVPYSVVENLRIPKFYQQCIVSWQEFLKQQVNNTWTKIKILNERLWFNPNLKVNGEMLDNRFLAKSGICTVGDIIQIDGNIRHQEIKVKVKSVNVTLYINKIMAAIPMSWKQTLQTRENDQNHTSLNNENEHQLIQNTQENSGKLTSRMIYERLNKKASKTRWEIQWEKQYGAQNWKTIYHATRNRLVERKCSDMNWKSLTYGLNTEEKLQKMKLSNGKCMLCTVETEDIEHLFYGCELIDRTWAFFNKLCQKIWNVALTEQNILLLVNRERTNITPKTEVINYIIMSVKWILWKNRNTLKYDHKWNNETETEQWAKQYLINRTDIIIKTNIKETIRRELKKLHSYLT